MRILVDFDGTIVHNLHPYDDLETPLTFIDGAYQGLLALVRADHDLVLWSARASWVLRKGPEFDIFPDRTPPRNSALNEARYQQMLRFVAEHLAGIFVAIEDGSSRGKPIVDLIIDDKAIRLGAGLGGNHWDTIVHSYGEHERVDFAHGGEERDNSPEEVISRSGDG